MPKTAITPKEKPPTVEEKLDEIAMYLQRMDKRDHRRMVGTYVKSIFTMTSIVFFLVSTVWFAIYGPQLIQDITKQMTSQMIQQGNNTGGMPTLHSVTGSN